MNYISGKIVRTGLRLSTKHHFVRKATRKGRGIRSLIWWLTGFSDDWQQVMSDAPNMPQPLRFSVQTSLFKFSSVTIHARPFYQDYLNKLRNSTNLYNGLGDIPFEFLVQPPLPIFDKVVPTRNDNISFQQSLSKGAK